MTPDQNPPKCPHLWVERVDGYFDCSFCKETSLDPEAANQNPPVDTAALAAAETKVLPRPPEGYRILEVGEKIHTGDKFVGIRLEFSQGFDTHCAGETVPNHKDGLYFRPIDPVPHTEGSSPAMWMADSRPLLAEISSLKGQLDAAQVQVSTLTDALTKAREIADRMDTDGQTYWAKALRALLESPALVQALKGGAQ